MEYTYLDITGGVLKEFDAFCQIPHSSCHEEAIANYLVRRLTELGGKNVIKDDYHNVIATFDATEGLEDSPIVILQGHSDMVCAIADGDTFNPLTDPISTTIVDGWLKTDGRSSLGADCGIGNACIFQILAAGNPHGPLKVLITSMEEVGLVGAREVDPDWVKDAEYLINVDGFHLGDLIYASAAGLRETFSIHTQWKTPSYPCALTIKISDCLGGHSGYDIAKNRANPIRLLANLLQTLKTNDNLPISFELGSISGGSSHNAIPMAASATVILPFESVDLFKDFAEQYGEMLEASFYMTDPNVRLTVEDAPCPERVLEDSFAHTILSSLTEVFIGPYNVENSPPHAVISSANLGQVSITDDMCDIKLFIRSHNNGDLSALSQQHGNACKSFELISNGYPVWPGNPQDPLVTLMAAQYQNISGWPPHISAVHVGLEPSVLYAKNPNLHIVNAGPDILDPHSVSERVRLDSITPYVRLLSSTLAAIAHK